MTFDESIAARTIWAEARGEPEMGQRAVAHVIVNRRRTGRWGIFLASVCCSPKQFSCWNDSDIQRMRMVTLPDDEPALKRFAEMLSAAEAGGPDPTQGAMHYFSIRMATPSWALTKEGQMLPFTQIGNHRFVRGVR